MAGDIDIFTGQEAGPGKEGLADTFARIVGRAWGKAFPKENIYDAKVIQGWMFGEPELRCDNNGFAKWEKVQYNEKDKWGTDANRYFRHGGWSVHMNGGEQDQGEDWASIWIPVNDMPLTALKELLWTYYKYVAGTATCGVCPPNIVITTRNPDDPDERADITQQASHGAAVTAGWHDDTIVPSSTAYLFWYGNNVTSDLTEGSLYTLAQFQADKAFKRHVIYLIKLDYGYWDGARTTGDVWVGSLQVNGQHVLNGPSLKEEVMDVLDKQAYAVKTTEQWTFGQPEIKQDNRGWGKWERAARNAKSPFYWGSDYNRQFRYGNWAVHLNGGAQSTDECWASVSIPVNNMPLVDFYEIAWTYYKFLAGTADVGAAAPALVIQTRRKNDYDIRSDITQTASAAGAVTEGWHETIMRRDTAAQMFYYGTGVTSNLTEGTNYTIQQFQEDIEFSQHVVYMMKLEYGYWGGTRSTGDVWIGTVRVNGIEIPLIPDEAQKAEVAEYEKKMFGEPTLSAANNSSASWARGCVSPLDQKSNTGWLANLYGGIQTNDDWARAEIPVNEIPVSCFNNALWTYYMTATETMGVNIVIWVHDPFDFDKRAEITQDATIATLEKAAGWNAHEFDPTVTQMFYYGEGVANTSITPTAGTKYTWAQFQGDECFNTWTVYKITIEYGWEASGTFDDAWVADIQLNGQKIMLKPDSGGSGRIARRYVEQAGAGAVALTIAPKTPYRLLTLDVHASAVLDTGEVLTITKDAGRGTSFDTVVLSEDLFIGSRTSYFATFGEGYDFDPDDELDIAQANGSGDTIGVAVRYQTVFD